MKRVDAISWWPAVLPIAFGSSIILAGRRLLRWMDDRIGAVEFVGDDE